MDGCIAETLASRDSDGYYNVSRAFWDLIISGGSMFIRLRLSVCCWIWTASNRSLWWGSPMMNGERWLWPWSSVQPSWDRGSAAIVIARKVEAPLYKRPRHVIDVGENFPRNAVGKVQKAKLRDFGTETLWIDRATGGGKMIWMVIGLSAREHSCFHYRRAVGNDNVLHSVHWRRKTRSGSKFQSIYIRTEDTIRLVSGFRVE